MQKLVFVNGAGTQIDLTAGNFGITNWEGLSNTGLNIQTQQVPFEDGAVFLDALMEPREITVTIAICDGNNLELRYQKKRELISALNPKFGEGTLIYTNDYLSKQIKVVPQIPLFENKNSNDAGTLKASVAFSCPSPYWEDLEETEVTFGINEQPKINNNGDVPTHLLINFYTNNVTNPEITNLNNNKKIKYLGNLSTSLQINTNAGKKDVKTETITSELQNLLTSNYVRIKIVNHIFFIVGLNGLVLSSNDGEKWNCINTGYKYNFYDITYNENLNKYFIGGESNGANGRMICSTDLLNWQEISLSGMSVNKVYCLEYSKQLNLMVFVDSYYGTIYSSADGETWTLRGSSGSTHFVKLLWVDDLSLFILIGSLSAKIITSADGETWTERMNLFNSYLDDITYSKKLHKFVGVGNYAVYQSEDGITWNTLTNQGVGPDAKSVCYSENTELFLIVGLEGKIKYTRNPTNGVAWSTLESFTDSNFTNIIYNQAIGNYLIVSSNMETFRSTDGFKWESISKGNSLILSQIIYEKTHKILCIGSIYNSIDSKSWIYNATNQGALVAYSSKQKFFIASKALPNNIVYYSQDGKSWEEKTANINFLANKLIYNENLDMFIMAGFSLCISNDGINWTEAMQYMGAVDICDIPTKNEMVILSGNIYDGFTILKSNDGTNWTQTAQLGTSKLDGLTYSEQLGMYLVVGNSGLVKYSYDLINWVTVNADVAYNLSKVVYIKELGMFFSAGEDGVVAYSFNGVDWKYMQLNIDSNLIGIVYNPDEDAIIVSGNNSVILKFNFMFDENVIQNISNDSDMNFNLDVGENQLRLNKESGAFICRVLYRQKYIGV